LWTAALLAVLLSAPALPHAPDTGTGESIYRSGIGSSGVAITGSRDSSAAVAGADAACANCHRRSGLGQLEGRISIPPISGPYLFHPRAKEGDDLDLPFVESMRPDREPYTEASLAQTIRSGVGPDGRVLSYLMPRYAIGDEDMASLIEYLKGMTPSSVPGVTASVLHFATIITPDADPVRRRATLSVLEQYFTDKNAFARAASERLRSSHRMMFKANRHWMLHVWELSGAPDTWEQQLQLDLRREPVLAVISGAGGSNWSPVHRFCEHASLPCLFPNVELPVVDDRDFYSMYFSRGVLLEADLIAHQLSADREGRSAAQRVVELYRHGDVGAAAAAQLAAAFPDDAYTVLRRPVDGNPGRAGVAAALRDVRPQDIVVLWLRPSDLTELARVPVRARTVYMSALMGGLERTTLPQAWRPVTRMAYPFDLPAGRRIRMDYPLGWFSMRGIAVVDEQVQADTYLACGLLAETLSHMSDSFIRDYLLERLEGMLEHRVITGYYPHLSLAPGQRFASKGGYLVSFDGGQGPGIRAASEWITP